MPPLQYDTFPPADYRLPGRVLAVDVGGVLASKQHDGQPVEGSCESLTRLATLYTVVIVSQCGRNRALQTREWLHRYFPWIANDRQWYVSFKQHKAPVLRYLNADAFIDDRRKHAVPASFVVETVCLFSPEGHGTNDLPDNVFPCSTWLEVEAILRSIL